MNGIQPATSWTEARQAIESLFKTIEETPLSANIWNLVEEQVAANPGKPMWTFFEEAQDSAATYDDVKALVDRTAAALYKAGVRKGSHVAVMLPNIPQFPATWLAIARLGAVMVPVNIAYTGRELYYVLTDSDANFLVIHSDCMPAYAALDGEAPFASDNVLVVGAAPPGNRDFGELIASAPDLPAGLPQPEIDDLVNIQYTSGTTGFPKGCMLTHRYWLTLSLVAAMRGGQDEQATNILVAQPYFYMDPQWLTLMAMRGGGQIFVARRASSSRFMDWVRQYDIHYCLFPEVVYQMPRQDADSDNSLKRISIFGFSKSQHADLERRYNTIARESFGMTEVGPALFTPREATHMVGSGTCGIPAPFREAKIVDEHGEEVGPGQIGELCIRGPGIMLGYYKKPEANETSFYGDWFRTGDLFWRDEQGFHYIVGRLKDMIRRSGENIAAREVEAVLREIPGVLEAAAVGVKDPTRGEEVKAYLVLQPGMTQRDVAPDAVFEHCKNRLAAFKIPRFLEYRDVLPKTPSEKIAKQKLVAEKPDLRVGSYDRVASAWL
jgi:acyl-CoA synthetase (AMP-forming)/AMP-acid ligase II